MESCVFCKIRDIIIPKEFIYEDEDIMVFPDINPIKPIHLLIVAKKHIEDLLNMNDDKLLIKMMRTVKMMAKEKGLSDKGFRVGINGGGAQAINHFHIHLIGPMGKGVKM